MIIRRLILLPLKEQLELLKTATLSGSHSNPLKDADISVAFESQEDSVKSTNITLDCQSWFPDTGTFNGSDAIGWTGDGYDAYRLIKAAVSISVRTPSRWHASDCVAVLFTYITEFREQIGSNTGCTFIVRNVVEPRKTSGTSAMFEGGISIEAQLPLSVVQEKTADSVRSIQIALNTDSIEQGVHAG